MIRVLCTGTEYENGLITIGKWYYVQREWTVPKGEGYSTRHIQYFYSIGENDEGTTKTYPQHLFITEQKHRDNKLKDLLRD